MRSGFEARATLRQYAPIVRGLVERCCAPFAIAHAKGPVARHIARVGVPEEEDQTAFTQAIYELRACGFRGGCRRMLPRRLGRNGTKCHERKRNKHAPWEVRSQVAPHLLKCAPKRERAKPFVQRL
jgi:hypothetical protein